LVVVDEYNETPLVFENNFDEGGSFGIFEKPNYNGGVLPAIEKI
jgi:hypothetical protein